MTLRPTSVAFTVLLGTLAALPPLSVDMGLPALPVLERGLGAAPGQAALTLSLFLFGVALPQLLIGPVSDRIGRRPVLLAGLSLYVLAGLGCALARSIEVLLALRVLQGIGAAAGTVLSFAMVRDVFRGSQARMKLSTITMVFAVAPMIAPAVGGVMLHLGGWQAIYALLAASGLVLLGVVALAMPETRPAELAGEALDLGGRYDAVLRQRSCIGHVAATALNFGCLFSFVASSPTLLLDDLGLSVPMFGGLFALTSFGILAGGWVSGGLIARGVSGVALMDWGLGLSLGASLMLSALLAAGLPTLGSVVPLLLAVSVCRGLIAPNAMHAVLEPVPAHAGSASALVACSQTLMGAVAGSLVALLYPVLGSLGMTLAMTLFAVTALLARRYADRPATAVLLSRVSP